MTSDPTSDGTAGNTLSIDSNDELPSEFIEAKRLGIGLWIAVGWIVLIVLLAALAPVLPIKDPDKNYIQTGRRAPYSPSLTHWMGTDQDARDMFARTVFGARVSLMVGFAAIAFGIVIGGPLGMIAGFVRGWFDRIVSFLFLVLLSFPVLVLAILITALVDRSALTISLTLGLLAIAPVGRLARAATLVFAEREFVIAARMIGAKNSRILLRELLPNVVIPMAALTLLGVAVAVVAGGGLAFLGLSVESGSTWGKLILTGSGTRTLESSPWVAFGPIIVLFLTVVALNFAGDRLRDYFDVKELAL